MNITTRGIDKNAAQHTPGPWRFDTNPSSFSYGDVVADHVRDSDIPAIICQMKWRNGEANARLIAAAPEMLALLRDIEASLTADNTYRLLREAAQDLLARIDGGEE